MVDEADAAESEPLEELGEEPVAESEPPEVVVVDDEPEEVDELDEPRASFL